MNVNNDENFFIFHPTTRRERFVPTNSSVGWKNYVGVSSFALKIHADFPLHPKKGSNRQIHLRVEE
jgi:hypothetical protein